MSVHRCAIVLAALTVLAAPVAEADHHTSLPFKPGRYSGFTTQTCPAEPLPAGACKPGERLPISFTVTSKAFSKLTVVVAERCYSEGQPSGVVHTITEASSGERHFAIEKRQAGFEYIGRRTSVGRDSVHAFLHGQVAHGYLLSSLAINGAGEPDPQSNNFCYSPEPSVKWRAKRQGG